MSNVTRLFPEGKSHCVCGWKLPKHVSYKAVIGDKDDSLLGIATEVANNLDVTVEFNCPECNKEFYVYWDKKHRKIEPMGG